MSKVTIEVEVDIGDISINDIIDEFGTDLLDEFEYESIADHCGNDLLDYYEIEDLLKCAGASDYSDLKEEVGKLRKQLELASMENV